MPTLDASRLLRQGLLEGVSVLVAGTTEPVAPLGAAVDETCTALGARVHMCVPDVADEAVVDEMVIAAVTETGSLDMLVVDGAGLFAHGLTHGGSADGGNGADADALGGGTESEAAHAALRTCLDAAWNVTRAIVNHAFLPAGSSPSTRRIVYLAPVSNAGEHADAARAGLENLGRTLSVEWARHGITVVTIAPGEASTAGEVAALCAYLASPAGAYFSGCLLDLRGV